MKTGTARKGMRVKIIGNHNCHGFRIGQIITLGDKTGWYPVNGYGDSFLVPSENGAAYFVREIDMAPAGATIV